LKTKNEGERLRWSVERGAVESAVGHHRLTQRSVGWREDIYLKRADGTQTLPLFTVTLTLSNLVGIVGAA
jgi:hypothetical protein